MRRPPLFPVARATAVCSLFAVAAVTALAGPVTWTLENVTFADGGTAFGQFAWDADTQDLTNVDITTTAGSFGSGAVYSGSLSLGFSSGLDLFDIGTGCFGRCDGDGFLLQLNPVAYLTDAGGNIALSPETTGGFSFEREDYYPLAGGQNNVYGREIASGSLQSSTASAPEPSTFLPVLAALVWGGSRRRVPRIPSYATK